jgi:NAD(P)-dependent dehydrogenase (short-subunit alcohol dehydrogenase family)
MQNFGQLDILVNNAGGIIKIESAITMGKELCEDQIQQDDLRVEKKSESSRPSNR